MSARVAHVGIIVRDIEPQIGFYQLVFGLELSARRRLPNGFSSAISGIAGADIEVAFLGSPDLPGSLEFLKYNSGHDDDGLTLPNQLHANHVCFRVEDSAATNRLIRENGGEVVSEPRSTQPGSSCSTTHVIRRAA